MSLDPQPLGELAAEMMDMLEARYAETGRELAFDALMIIAAVREAEATGSESGMTGYQWVSTDHRFHVQYGLLHGVAELVLLKGQQQA